MSEAEAAAVAPRSPGSIRAKRYRDRQRNGKILIHCELTPEGVEQLVAQGWLAREKRDDWRAVADAFLRLGASVLWPENRRHS